MRAVPSPPFLRRLVKGLPVTAKMMPVAKRKFGCLMGMLPPLFTKTITDWSLENIPDFHLGPGGREFRSHITTKFGFVDSSPNTIEAIREFLQGRPPLQVRLGGFDLFTTGYGKWKNEDGDVLFVEVDSPDLHRLNAELSAAFPCKDTHPEYKPHVTVAYLDPSVAESYRNLKAPFLNCSMILDTLEWSGADGVTEQFSLSILPQLGVSDMQVTPPSLKSLPNYGSKGEGTCKQGERSDLTGCTPASGGGGKKPSGGSDEGKAPSQPQTRRQKLREKLRKAKERAKAIKDKIKEGGDRAISTAGKVIVITKNFFRDLSERVLGKAATKTAEVVIEKVQDTVNQILLGEDYDIPDDPAGLGLDIALNLVPDTVAYLYRVAKVALGGKDPREIKYPEKSLSEGIDLSEIADMIVGLQEEYIQAGMDVVPMDRDGVLELLEQNLAEPGAVGQKSMIYWVKGEGSYFGNCERDEQGHCLPSGEAGQKKPAERPKQTRKDKRQAGKQKRQKVRQRTKQQRQAVRNLAKGVSKIKDAVTSKMKKVNGKLQMTKAAAVAGVDKLIDWAKEKFDLDEGDVKRMKDKLHGYAKDRTDDFGKTGELPSPHKFGSVLKTLRQFAPEVVGQITRRIKKVTTGKDPREQAVDNTSTLRRILGPKLHAAVLGPVGGRAKPTAPTEEQATKLRAALEKEWAKIQKEGKGEKYLPMFQKALSWLDSNNGGALVPPAQMGKKIPLGRPRKGKKLTPPSLKTFGWHKDNPDEKDSLNELKAFPLPTRPEEEDAHQIGQALEMALERYNKLRHSIGDNDVMGVRNAVNNPKWMLMEAAKDDVERLERHYAQARGKSVEQKALEIGRMLGGGHTFRRVDGFVKGFTGERPDKLGRRMCYRDGKRVPCPKKEGEIPKNPKPADENSGGVDLPDTTTPAEKEPVRPDFIPSRDPAEVQSDIADTEQELETLRKVNLEGQSIGVRHGIEKARKKAEKDLEELRREVADAEPETPAATADGPMPAVKPPSVRKRTPKKPALKPKAKKPIKKEVDKVKKGDKIIDK